MWALMVGCGTLQGISVDRLLTPKQVSELLQVDLSTVYKWSHMEFIPHVRLGRSIRFIEGEVAEWLLKRREAGRTSLRYNKEVLG